MSRRTHLSMSRPTKKLIMEMWGSDVDDYDAAWWIRQIHAAEKGKLSDWEYYAGIEVILDRWNTARGNYGTEVIRCERQVEYYRDVNLLYVNVGDPYRATLLFDTYEGKFYVGGWGDWVEAMERKHGDGWCP